MITVIAEKPSVGKSLARVLGANKIMDGYREGNGYIVTWAFGHLAVLAPPEMYGTNKIPIIPNTFKLVSRREKTAKGYEPDKDALKQLKVIKSAFERCNSIIVATDSGREGEAIFRNIYKLLECNKPFSRLWISSLTDKAITEGFACLKPGADYDSLHYAAEARAQADWLVGINGSRALSMITGDNNHSLGRVQTPTLAMVCARYEENRNFKPEHYRIFKSGIEKDGVPFHLTAKEKKYNKAEATEFFNRLKNDSSIRITKVEQKETTQSPPLLYDLSSLQQDANRQHGFTAEQTLNIAQKLYEEKFISYPRTGSRYISEDVFEEIPHLIKSLETHPLFGAHAATILPNVTNVSNVTFNTVNNAKVTDHHALVITGNIPGTLGKDEQIIYEMIAGRMLEAFSPKCVKEMLVIRAESESGIEFETRGSKVKEAGWRGVFNLSEENPEDENTQPLPALSEGEQFTPFCSNMLGKETRPKPVYTEATLLAAMEQAGKKPADEQQPESTGIGTPATRAGIIETLLKRDYMERDKKNLIPTQKGLQLYNAVKSLQIADANLTVEWEGKLAQIEREPAFRDTFMEQIREYTQKVVDEISSVEFLDNNRKLPCPKCKSGSVAIFGKVAKCNNATCNLTVFKSVCGKNLTENQIAELLINKKTGLIKGFKNKQGKGFDAILRFDEEFKTVFQFVSQKNKRDN